MGGGECVVFVQLILNVDRLIRPNPVCIRSYIFTVVSATHTHVCRTHQIKTILHAGKQQDYCADSFITCTYTDTTYIYHKNERNTVKPPSLQ